jgi:hypothetical protein
MPISASAGKVRLLQIVWIVLNIEENTAFPSPCQVPSTLSICFCHIPLATYHLLYTRPPRTPNQYTYTLKMATAMSAETLDKLQHSTWLIPENRSHALCIKMLASLNIMSSPNFPLKYCNSGPSGFLPFVSGVTINLAGGCRHLFFISAAQRGSPN